MAIRLLPAKYGRLLFLVAVLLVVWAGDAWYRRWKPICQVQTIHYNISSSTTFEKTREMGSRLELLHSAYCSVLYHRFPQTQQPHERLLVRLYNDRKEFRRCNRITDWAEAFYQYPTCHAYYPDGELNPYHWMLHEATHQLNHEVAGIKSPQWVDEGLSTYFSTSKVIDQALAPGKVDPDTYPVWYMNEMEFSSDLQKDLQSGKVISLEKIVTGRGGPSMNEEFNRYYVHWWSLCHFLIHFENGRYREGFFNVIHEEGSLESFTKQIGPVDRIQTEWYGHLMSLKASLFPSPGMKSRIDGVESRAMAK